MALQILFNIILPVFILIGLGGLIDRLLPVDLSTLSKLSFYVFLPAVVFIKLLDSDLTAGIFGTVVIFCFIHMFITLLICWGCFGHHSFRQQRPVLAMGALFYNAGNFGFPFAQLAFGSLGTSVMAIMLTTQLISNFTVGLWLMGIGKGRWTKILKSFLRVPVIYIILAALLLNALNLHLPDPLYNSINYLADGLIPMALLTLGVQLSRSKVFGQPLAISSVTLMRLVISPLLALGIVSLWALVDPAQMALLGPILIAGFGLPVAVNVYLLAVEYGQDPELPSQSVFWTTLLSALTLTAWLAILGTQ